MKLNMFLNLFIVTYGGPYRVPLSSGAHYFLTTVDDASQATWVYLIREKGEMSDLLRGFIAMTKNQFRKNVKVVRSDNGSKFTSNPMQVFYQDEGILRQRSYVDTPPTEWEG